VHRPTAPPLCDNSRIAFKEDVLRDKVAQLTRYKAQLKQHFAGKFAGGYDSSCCDSSWSSGPIPKSIHALSESDQFEPQFGYRAEVDVIVGHFVSSAPVEGNCPNHFRTVA
jgi:hypothetical protein